jgi:hypothetical protein
MEMIVWIGAALTLVGLGMLVWCIVSVAKAKRAGLAETELKDAASEDRGAEPRGARRSRGSA